MKGILILTDRQTQLKELISGAYALTGRRPAVVTSDRDTEGLALSAGADVYRIVPAGETIWDETDTVAALVKETEPKAIFMGTSQNCRLLAGRLAARLGVTAWPDVKGISDAFETTHLVYGGDAVMLARSTGGPCIALFGPGQFEETAHPADGVVREVPLIAPKWQIKVKETRKKETGTTDLAAAKRIVAVGLGIAREEDLEMVRELAALLEAELGCTRPVAEGLNWMSPEQYIGISANFVKPDLYLALGISGQVQHTVGIADSKVVVSVNKDPDCAMMKQYSDYCLTGDLYEIVPALIRKLKQAAMEEG